MNPSRFNRGELADGRTNSRVFVGRMSRFDYLDRPKLRTKQDESTAVLWNAVIGTRNDRVRNMIIQFRQSRDEFCEDGMSLQFWHVFHADHFRPRLLHEPPERAEQAPLYVSLRIESLGVFGERLTRGAA